MTFESDTTASLPRQILEHELSARMKKNPRYSLRSFARSLRVSHSLLSQLISGKRNVSKKTLGKMMASLNLSPQEILALGRARLRFPPTPEEKLAEQFDSMSLDMFSVVSDWYHYAILSLLELPGARLEPKWISRRLAITERQASLAIRRLKRLSLVERVGKRWKQSNRPLRLDNRFSTEATRKHHRQLLRKAEESLDRDPFELRDLSSVTFAMDPRCVPYAREQIKQFKWHLMNELERMGQPEQVYNLSVQIYPVSRGGDSNAKKQHS